LHPGGVPSLAAIEAEVRPGCCDASARQVRISQIQDMVQVDLSISADNRALAGDMLRHCANYGTTFWANCTVGLGILCLGHSIIQFCTGTYLWLAFVFLLLAVSLLGAWAARLCGERRSRARLLARERAALTRATQLMQQPQPQMPQGPRMPMQMQMPMPQQQFGDVQTI
jgi:hypothetical protein